VPFRAVFVGIILLFAYHSSTAQEGELELEEYKTLPKDVYQSIQEEVNGVDITFFPPSTRSISFQGKNASLFLDFILDEPPTSMEAESSGFIMLLINGEMIVSGNLFFGADDQAAFEFTYDEKKFYHRVSPSGFKFLKDSM
jgi:hypothetical protein